MNREKAYVTADDKLRVPSLSGESIHEYSATDGGIMYRRIGLDGSPQRGRFGLWKPLSRYEVLKHLITRGWHAAVVRWFSERGITIERLRDERANELRKLRHVHKKR